MTSKREAIDIKSLLNDGIYEYIKEVDYTTTWSVAHHMRFLIIANVIRKNGFKKVLDVGFGNAVLPMYLNKLKFDGEYIGTDLNTQYVEEAKNMRFDFTARFYDKPAYQINEKIDCVVLGELIEHLAKKEATKFLNHCRSLLTPNGYIILTTPNKQKEKVNWPDDHVDEYAYEELIELFKNCQLEVNSCVGLWSNTKSTLEFIDVVEQEMYQKYEKLIPNSILNVLFNILYPKKSKHLLFVLSRVKK